MRVHQTIYDTGDPEETRTLDPLIRSQVLYPTELQGHVYSIISFSFLILNTNLSSTGFSCAIIDIYGSVAICDVTKIELCNISFYMVES